MGSDYCFSLEIIHTVTYLYFKISRGRTYTRSEENTSLVQVVKLETDIVTSIICKSLFYFS